MKIGDKLEGTITGIQPYEPSLNSPREIRD